MNVNFNRVTAGQWTVQQALDESVKYARQLLIDSGELKQ
jgi:hypothetical protein